MTVISAHFGHWYTSLLYVAPVALIVIVLAVQSRRDRRRDDDRH
jgi:cytochrome c-type biogenesis protein CcmH/NrfF